MKRTQIQLDDATYEAVRRRAFDEGRSMASVVREELAEAFGTETRKRRWTIDDFKFVGMGRDPNNPPDAPVSGEPRRCAGRSLRRLGSAGAKMIFVDTSAIFALADELDIHHQDAKRLFDALLRTERRRVTHSYVLIESMALLQRRLGREQAMEFATATAAFEVEWVGERLHGAAVQALHGQPRGISLVDQGELPGHAPARNRRGVRVRQRLHGGRVSAVRRMSGCTRPPGAHAPDGR